MINIEVDISRKVFLPCYYHLIESDADINFLWGGRDSGKSHFIAQRLIIKCMKADYFKCILIKQTANTIKESQWETIKSIVNDWNLSSLFTFTENPLQIKCSNGNRFIARGCDDIGNIKSVKDPTDVWYEEGNQISLTDFVTIVTTLRSNKSKIQQWFSFNPECDGDYTDFWLYKAFFEDRSDWNFTDTWSIDVKDKDPVIITFTSTHTTYHDNKYCSDVRRAFLEQLEDLEPYYYLVFTLGIWGNRKVGDPYVLTFDKEKHTGKVDISPRLELYLSFDFNINPITCGVYQSKYLGNIKCIEAINLGNSDIYKLCDFIKANYPNYLYIVTGDATGRNSSALVQDGLNYYTVIKSKLGLNQPQMKQPTINPNVAENRALVNAAFKQGNILIDKQKAKALIFDCMNVSVNDMGKIDKGDRKNPKKRADHLDHFRYYLNTFHKALLKE